MCIFSVTKGDYLTRTCGYIINTQKINKYVNLILLETNKRVWEHDFRNKWGISLLQVLLLCSKTGKLANIKMLTYPQFSFPQDLLRCFWPHLLGSSFTECPVLALPGLSPGLLSDIWAWHTMGPTGCCWVMFKPEASGIDSQCSVVIS